MSGTAPSSGHPGEPITRGAGSQVLVGVIGPGTPPPDEAALVLERAEQIGRGVARHGGILVCGGLGGVMEAACRGAAEVGGLTVGLLPSAERRTANPHVKVPIATGLGELRNGIVVQASDVLIAVGGEYGTLSELALAVKTGKPVVGLDTWRLRRPSGVAEAAWTTVDSPDVAVSAAFALAATSRRDR